MLIGGYSFTGGLKAMSYYFQILALISFVVGVVSGCLALSLYVLSFWP